jgi:hypothetical protein
MGVSKNGLISRCMAKNQKIRKREKTNRTHTMTSKTPQNSLGPFTIRSRGRPTGSQPFSDQRGGERSSTLSAFNQFIDNRAGDDATGLILAYLESRHAKTRFNYRQFDRSFELSRIKKLLTGFKPIYETTPDYNKVQYLSIFRNASLTRRELIQMNYKVSSTAWAGAGKHLGEFGVAAPRPVQKKREIPQGIVTKIRDMFYSDEISFNSSYRTIIKSVRDPAYPKQFLRNVDTGEIIKEVVNVRFLNNVSRSFVWDKFKSENPDAQIKRAKFFELIPKEIKDGHRETDKCPVCHYGKKIVSELTSLEQGIHSNCLNCDMTNCHVEDDISPQIKQELKTLRDNLVVYRQHVSDNLRQQESINQDIASLKDREALFVIDFKANLKVNQHRVQLNHEFYQQHSRSLLGVAVVLPDKVSKENNIHNIVYIDILSDNLSHNAHFVITSLKSVFEHEFIQNLNLSKITFWMDGAGHFKNGQLAKYFSDVELEKNIKLKWNYFTEYHGKSLCDGRFGNISRFIAEELKSKRGSIESTEDLIQVIQRGQDNSNNVRARKKQQPIKSIQLTIDVPVIDKIDSYVIKNIKTFHSFSSSAGEISCYVNSSDTISTVQPRKIEQVTLNGIVRRGYQTQVFNVDTLFNGVKDKQVKQTHFRDGGALNKAPKSKRKSKANNNNASALSQPAPDFNAEYDIFNFYSQGSAISDDDIERHSPRLNSETSPPILANPTSIAPQIVDEVNMELVSFMQTPLYQQLQEMLNSGQISDVNSYFSSFTPFIESAVSSNTSENICPVNLGPLTQILNRVM